MGAKFDNERNEVMESVKNLLVEKGNDVLPTNSNEFCIPIVNGDGDEAYIVITFKIPKGSRDGTAYNGYEVSEDYLRDVAIKAEKKKIAEQKKKEKIARDTKAREEKKRKEEGE